MQPQPVPAPQPDDQAAARRDVARKVGEPVMVPPLEELLLDFESFGDNCEFGVLQRDAGLEPLGLLRFSLTPMPALLRALQNHFSGIADLDKIEMKPGVNKELTAILTEYDFGYHVGKKEGEASIETLRKAEAKKLGFLVRRLNASLASGEKIIVRKGEGAKTLQDAQALLARLQAHGPVTLLWVTEANANNPPGTVRLVEPYLMRGYIDRFAPYTDAHNISFRCWADICENAWWLWKTNPPPGRRLRPPVRVDLAANLLYGGDRAVTIEKRAERIETAPGHALFPLRVPHGATICRHVLKGEDGFVGVWLSGLRPDAPYTFSLWMKLLPGHGIVEAFADAPGCPRIRGRRPDLLLHDVWQRLEIAVKIAGEGLLFARIELRGVVGAVFQTANWRLEPGLVIGADESPDDLQPRKVDAALLGAR